MSPSLSLERQTASRPIQGVIQTLDIKLYGGPAHGLVHTVECNQYQKSKTHRIDALNEVLRRPVVLRHTDADLWQPQPYTLASYYLQPFAQQFINPQRERSLWIGLCENCELLNREYYELEQDIRRIPWIFPEVSILNDFHEWFAQAVYKHTGILTWRGQRIPPDWP